VKRWFIHILILYQLHCTLLNWFCFCHDDGILDAFQTDAFAQLYFVVKLDSCWDLFLRLANWSHPLLAGSKAPEWTVAMLETKVGLRMSCPRSMTHVHKHPQTTIHIRRLTSYYGKLRETRNHFLCNNHFGNWYMTLNPPLGQKCFGTFGAWDEETNSGRPYGILRIILRMFWSSSQDQSHLGRTSSNKTLFGVSVFGLKTSKLCTLGRLKYVRYC